MSICFVFCFKQKTVYEMRISDWSSDVCSSDLVHVPGVSSCRLSGIKLLHDDRNHINNIIHDMCRLIFLQFRTAKGAGGDANYVTASGVLSFPDIYLSVANLGYFPEIGRAHV